MSILDSMYVTRPRNVDPYIEQLLSCQICSQLCQRGITMVCCGVQACRLCAKTKVEQKSRCWNCKSSVTSEDLLNCKLLRGAVNDYRLGKEINLHDLAIFQGRQSSENPDKDESDNENPGSEITDTNKDALEDFPDTQAEQSSASQHIDDKSEAIEKEDDCQNDKNINPCDSSDGPQTTLKANKKIVSSLKSVLFLFSTPTIVQLKYLDSNTKSVRCFVRPDEQKNLPMWTEVIRDESTGKSYTIIQAHFPYRAEDTVVEQNYLEPVSTLLGKKSIFHVNFQKMGHFTTSPKERDENTTSPKERDENTTSPKERDENTTIPKERDNNTSNSFKDIPVILRQDVKISGVWTLLAEVDLKERVINFTEDEEQTSEDPFFNHFQNVDKGVPDEELFLLEDNHPEFEILNPLAYSRGKMLRIILVPRPFKTITLKKGCVLTRASSLDPQEYGIKDLIKLVEKKSNFLFNWSVKNMSLTTRTCPPQQKVKLSKKQKREAIRSTAEKSSSSCKNAEVSKAPSVEAIDEDVGNDGTAKKVGALKDSTSSAKNKDMPSSSGENKPAPGEGTARQNSKRKRQKAKRLLEQEEKAINSNHNKLTNSQNMVTKPKPEELLEGPGDWFQIDQYFEKIVHEPPKPTKKVKSKKKKKPSKNMTASTSFTGNLPGKAPYLSQTNALPLGKRAASTSNKIALPLPLPVPLPVSLPLPLPLPLPVPPGKKAPASSFWKNSITEDINFSGKPEYHSFENNVNDYIYGNPDHPNFCGNLENTRFGDITVKESFGGNPEKLNFESKDDGYINIYDGNLDNHKPEYNKSGGNPEYQSSSSKPEYNKSGCNPEYHRSGGNPDSDDRYIRGYLQQYGNHDQLNLSEIPECDNLEDGNPETTRSSKVNSYINVYDGNADNQSFADNNYENKFVDNQTRNSSYDQKVVGNLSTSKNRNFSRSTNFHGFCVNPENFSGEESTFSTIPGSKRSSLKENTVKSDQAGGFSPLVFGRRLQGEKSSRKSTIDDDHSSSNQYSQVNQKNEISPFAYEYGDNDRSSEDRDESIDDDNNSEVEDYQPNYRNLEDSETDRLNKDSQRIKPSSSNYLSENSFRTVTVKPSMDNLSKHYDQKNKVYETPNKNQINTKVKTNEKAELFFKAMDCKKLEVSKYNENMASPYIISASKKLSSMERDTMPQMSTNLEIKIENTARKSVEDSQDLQVITIDEDLEVHKDEKNTRRIKQSKDRHGHNKSSKSRHRSEGSTKNDDIKHLDRKHDNIKRREEKRHEEKKHGEKRASERRSRNRKDQEVDLLDEVRKNKEKEAKKAKSLIRSRNRKVQIDLKDELRMDKIRSANISKFKIKQEEKENEEKAKRKRKLSEERCEKRKRSDYEGKRRRDEDKETSSKRMRGKVDDVKKESQEEEIFEVTVDFEKNSRVFPQKRKIIEVSTKGEKSKEPEIRLPSEPRSSSDPRPSSEPRPSSDFIALPEQEQLLYSNIDIPLDEQLLRKSAREQFELLRIKEERLRLQELRLIEMEKINNLKEMASAQNITQKPKVPRLMDQVPLPPPNVIIPMMQRDQLINMNSSEMQRVQIPSERYSSFNQQTIQREHINPWASNEQQAASNEGDSSTDSIYVQFGRQQHQPISEEIQGTNQLQNKHWPNESVAGHNKFSRYEPASDYVAGPSQLQQQHHQSFEIIARPNQIRRYESNQDAEGGNIAGPNQFEYQQSFSGNTAGPNQFENQQSLSRSIAGPNQFENQQSFSGSIAGPNQFENQQTLFGNTVRQHNFGESNYASNLPNLDFTAQRAQVLGEIQMFDLELENLRNLRRQISSSAGSSGNYGSGSYGSGSYGSGNKRGRRGGGYGTGSFRN